MWHQGYSTGNDVYTQRNQGTGQLESQLEQLNSFFSSLCSAIVIFGQHGMLINCLFFNKLLCLLQFLHITGFALIYQDNCNYRSVGVNYF